MAPATGNILVVDDQRDDLRLITSILTERGYVVRPALDGASALAAARCESPDLVLLDIQMPQLDGYETCRRLKAQAQTRDIPVIFISARNEVFDKVQAFTSGGVDYVSKPYQAEEVVARIETQLRLAAMQQRLEAQNRVLQQEITERKRAEAELRNYQEQLESLVQARTIELSHTNAQLLREISERRQVEAQLTLALEAGALAVGDWDLLTDRVIWSVGIKRIGGFTEDIALDTFADIQKLVYLDDWPLMEQAIQYAIQEGAAFHVESRFYQGDGRIGWMEGKGLVLQDENDRPIRMLGVFQNISERKYAEERIRASLHEKEILLKEIHHRVKNNLQIIASLLYLQAQKINAPEFAELLNESQTRITSMAFVHEMLYQSDDYTRINFGSYIRSLATSLLAAYGLDRRRITLTISETDVTMNVNLAIPCGLIVNEIISNALKHAFPDGRQGNIRITVKQQPEGYYLLELSDDGVGLPAGAKPQPATLGLRLVDRLVKQLGGTLELQSNPGTSYRISFPKDA